MYLQKYYKKKSLENWNILYFSIIDGTVNIKNYLNWLFVKPIQMKRIFYEKIRYQEIFSL
jgi:hypothetical protein